MYGLASSRNAQLAGMTMALVLLLGPNASARGQPPPVIQVSGATRVEVDEQAGLWRLAGNPVVVSRGAVVVRAPDIRYDNRLLILHASGGVDYADGTVSVRSPETTVWLRDERAAAIGGVEATYREPGVVMRLRASRLDIWSRERRAVASGNVSLSRGEVVLDGDAVAYNHLERRGLISGGARLTADEGTLTADRIDARLAADEFLADGHVRLVQPDLEASAASLRLRRRDAVAVLTGSAMVRTRRGEMSAEAITLELNRRRVEASGRVRLIVAPQR